MYSLKTVGTKVILVCTSSTILHKLRLVQKQPGEQFAVFFLPIKKRNQAKKQIINKYK
jgi:hypothetical protein